MKPTASSNSPPSARPSAQVTSISLDGLRITRQEAINSSGERSVNLHIEQVSSSPTPLTSPRSVSAPGSAEPLPSSDSSTFEDVCWSPTSGPRGEHFYDIITPTEPPKEVLAHAIYLKPGGGLSADQRVARAYHLGRAAARFLRGESGKPSNPLNMRNCCYVVLRGPGIESPRFTRDYKTYRLQVGEPFDPTSSSHGFPSKVEAHAFSVGAGLHNLPPGP